MIKSLYLTCCFFLLALVTANAQVTVAGINGSQAQLVTYSEMLNGKTEEDQVKVSLQYFGTSLNVTKWRLTVRLTQNYVHSTNSAYSVGAQYSYLKYGGQENYSANNTQVVFPTQQIQLSTLNEVTLVDSNVALTPWVYRIFNFDHTIMGGNHLLVSPNGVYRSAYEFKLYNTAGTTPVLIGSYTASSTNSARFQIQYVGNNGNSLALQNGASLFNLQFNTAADFANGKSVTVNNGLRVNVGQSYQLSVKASGSQMTSATTSATIPVSKLKVQVTTTGVPSSSGVTVLGPKALSTTDQTIATRSGTNNGNTIQYNLNFFIDPGALQSNIPAGTYTTYVYFVIVPI